MLEQLLNLDKSDTYPFHMPGHKRQYRKGIVGEAFRLDITEISGFDDLHDPKGLIKSLLERMRAYFGGDEAFFLVNGSTSGVLAAISAALPHGGKLLMARNSHKSAFDAAAIRGLKLSFLYPPIVEGWGFCGSIAPLDVERALKEDASIGAVFLTSPTYEGIVSDICAIADICHGRGIPLIVDSAHGAHLGIYGPMGSDWNCPDALAAGADIAIESLHKTLPAFTQTAMLLKKGNLLDSERLKYYISAYQSSSPSYIFMAGLEQCLDILENEGQERFLRLCDMLSEFRHKIGALGHIRTAGAELLSSGAVYGYDPTKLLISADNLNGQDLSNILRDRYLLELEMAVGKYCLALTSLMDSREGFDRLEKALEEIDRECGSAPFFKGDDRLCLSEAIREQRFVLFSISEALEARKMALPLEKAENGISAAFVYAYPPGIPILVPGERIDRSQLILLKELQEEGSTVRGLSPDGLWVMEGCSAWISA
ncbi:MAG: decarboxylase [Lachnospiraceae bacterium]|nr:decarboxylase [Lachnospiraceae bacterium]